MMSVNSINSTDWLPVDSGSKPRILIMSTEFPPGPGGIGTHAWQLARHLCRLGWWVHVVAPQPYVSAEERQAFNQQQEFTVTTLPEREGGIGWLADRVRLVAAAVRSAVPDLIIASGRRSLLLANALRLVSRRPLVVIGHGSEFQTVSRLNAWLARQAIEHAVVVIAVSRYTADLINRAAAPRRLVIIPNAADGERFHPVADSQHLRHQWDLAGRRLILTVGQVSERKAQDIVIRALPRIAAEFPDVVYVMAGLPSREAEFAALAAELGVTDQVRFAGKVTDDDLLGLYGMAELFVLVSRRARDGDVEGYGIVVQEAALCGVAAVVSQECGLTEAIVDGITGVSVPPNDPEATATAVIALLADEERRREMGYKARELAQSATWAERVARYDQVLRGLLSLSAVPLPEGVVE